MQTTDPPVKVLLADGIHEARVGTVEQLPLIYFLPPVLLLHLPFLPRMVETRMLRTKVLTKEQSPEPIFLKIKKKKSCDQKVAVASLANPWRLKPQSTE